MSNHFSPDVATYRELQKLRPNFSEVARELGLTPQHVRRVFWGLTTSVRVTKALNASMRQKARKAEKQRKVAA